MAEFLRDFSFLDLPKIQEILWSVLELPSSSLLD